MRSVSWSGASSLSFFRCTLEPDIPYRYNGAVLFDPYMTNFKCPKCMNMCNCTHCCSKRGEPYVTTRGVKCNVPISEYYEKVWKTLQQAKAQRSKQNAGLNHRSLQRSNAGNTPAPAASAEPSAESKSVPPSAPKPKAKPRTIFEPSAKELEISKQLALPAGAVWGTIYGLDMGRIGVGVVADANSRIVVRKEVDRGTAEGAWGERLGG